MATADTIRIEETAAWRLALEAAIDPSAPVSASGSILIDRSAAGVWHLLHDVTNWPKIRADVQNVVALDGGVFTWSAGPIPVRSRFAVTEPGRALTWCTVTTGLEAVHVYRFDAVGSKTLLTAAESMNGPNITQLITSTQLVSQIASWLAGLKALAESR